MVTYGLGVGLPAFIVALLALRFVVAATAGSALAFAAGVLLAIHGLAPLWFGHPLDTVWQRPWFYYALEASLGLATWAAWCDGDGTPIFWGLVTDEAGAGPFKLRGTSGTMLYAGGAVLLTGALLG